MKKNIFFNAPSIVIYVYCWGTNFTLVWWFIKSVQIRERILLKYVLFIFQVWKQNSCWVIVTNGNSVEFSDF